MTPDNYMGLTNHDVMHAGDIFKCRIIILLTFV
jgi:hypothetical protein